MTAPVSPASSPNATAEKAHNKASPILVGYIFGKNKGERKLAMRNSVKPAAVPSGMGVNHESSRNGVGAAMSPAIFWRCAWVALLLAANAALAQPAAFAERVVKPVQGQLAFTLYHLTNTAAIHPSIYARFAFTATRR